MKKSRYNAARRWLIFWTLFIGIGAVAGALCMIIDPSGKTMGMDAMLPYFQVLPFAEVVFQDFTFSGCTLFIVNGITNLTAAMLLIKNKKFGVILGGVFGITLMLWICIQFYMFPLNFMSSIYFIFGFIQFVTGYSAWVFQRQEEFYVNTNEYRNIGTNKDKLVVYFSRMGYVKKVAYETANRVGADIYEIKSTEKIDATLGFWWCGRFAMHRWDMPIEHISVDLTKYTHVIICTPVWVFSLASPVRSFCRQVAGKIKNADYIAVHFSPGQYENIAMEMDDILGVSHAHFTSLICRTGNFLQGKDKKYK